MQHNNRIRPGAMLRIVIPATLLLLAACGGGPSATDGSTAPTATGPDTVKIVQEGGCQVMGPNCPTYELDRDGSVRLYRTGESEVVAEATVDAAVTGELWQQIADTDIAALMERAGPGTCQACVDGVDTVITFTDGDDEVALDSTMIAFDGGDPLFAIFNEAIEAMAEAAPMPIEQR